MRHYFAVLSLSALCGCQGPAPQPPSPPSIADTALPQGVDRQPLPEQWWSLYHQPALDRLVSQALHHNQDLAQADAHLKALIAVLHQQQAGLWPDTQVQAGVEYGRSTDDQVLAEATGGHATPHWEGGAGFNLAWQLDLFGQLRAAIATARANTQAQAAARDQLRLSIAAQTSQAYIDLCGYGAQEVLLQQSLDNLAASVQLSERLRQGGVATALDGRRLQALTSRTQAQLPWVQARQRIAGAQLALLTGQSSEDALALQTRCQSVPQLTTALPAGDAWHLVQRRPDIRQAERQLLAAEWTVQQVRADLYPKVSFGAALASSSHRLHNLGDSQALSLGIGPLISWQFPNLSANRARLQAADAEREASRAAWRASVLTALKDVRTALASYAGEHQRAEALTQAAAQSREAFELAQRSYNAGALDGLQQLDAQRELIDAQARQAEARQRQAHREIALFQALGGGWQNPDEHAIKDAQP